MLLAGATLLLLFVGTGPIAYLRTLAVVDHYAPTDCFAAIMEVGALIFVLGIDLVKEALWDTRHRTSRTEYITIVSIMICMTLWDFVVGVLFGIVVSCECMEAPEEGICADMFPLRFLLCRAELPAAQHTLGTYGRDGHVYCSSAKFTASLHPRSV